LAAYLLSDKNTNNKREGSKPQESYTRNEYTSADGTTYVTEEYVYDNNPLHSDVNFEQFRDYENYTNTLNLSKASVKECIVQYVNAKSISHPKHRRNYRLALSYLIALEQEYNVVIMPIVVGNKFWDQFESFLLNNDLATRTINAICTQIRCALRWASRFKADIAVDLDDKRFDCSDAKPKYALTEDDMSRIYWFDINSLPVRPQKKRTFEKVRDHFILSCYIGQRFSDSVRIENSNFSGAAAEVFRIVQQKTGQKAVLEFNKLYKDYPKHVKDILEKYDYNSPFTGDICNYNRYLHELMRDIGFDEVIKYEYKCRGKIITKTFHKWELISSHSARRTFITNAVKRGINTQIIRHASGHRSDSAFGKYVIFEDEEII
jgi:hypothetical protein